MSQSKLRSDVTPAFIGIIISAVLLIGLFLSEYLLSRFALLYGPESSLKRDFRIAVLHCLQTGYLPAAYIYTLRSARSAIHELEPMLALNNSYESSVVHRITKKEFIGIGFLGLFLAILSPYLSAESPWNLATWSPEVTWHRILGPVMGWWGLCLFYAILKESIKISRMAVLLRSIDLLDMKPLAPFVRQGLLNALLAVGWLSIISLFLLESGMGTTVASLAGIGLPVAFIGLFLPVFGVHRRLHEAKQSELAWVLERIRDARLRLKAPSMNPTPSLIVDLTTYYRFVEQIPTWPFRISTFARVLFYLAIPFVTWLAGVLVDSALTLFFR